MTAVIKTDKLTKYYGKHRGIIELDLEIEEGESFGFLGPNGAGKTTMIRTLLDHIRPTSGQATIFGIVTSHDPVAIHRRLGYLPGEFAPYDKLTGGQTLDYFANLRGGVDRSYQKRLSSALKLIQRAGSANTRKATSKRSDWSSPFSTGPSSSYSMSQRPASTRSSSRSSTRSFARRRKRAERSS